jgi:hypothetical protein
MLGRDTSAVDPSWPPVLIGFVVAALGAGVISVVVVYRRLRGERDRQGMRGGRGASRR